MTALLHYPDFCSSTETNSASALAFTVSFPCCTDFTIGQVNACLAVKYDVSIILLIGACDLLTRALNSDFS